jgi:hypothetical protein
LLVDLVGCDVSDRPAGFLFTRVDHAGVVTRLLVWYRGMSCRFES